MADNMNPMPPSQSITDIRMPRNNDPKQTLPDQTAQGGAPISDAVQSGAPKMGKI